VISLAFLGRRFTPGGTPHSQEVLNSSGASADGNDRAGEGGRGA
jgi:hypothetical protein